MEFSGYGFFPLIRIGIIELGSSIFYCLHVYKYLDDIVTDCNIFKHLSDSCKFVNNKVNV